LFKILLLCSNSKKGCWDENIFSPYSIQLRNATNSLAVVEHASGEIDPITRTFRTHKT